MSVPSEERWGEKGKGIIILLIALSVERIHFDT